MRIEVGVDVFIAAEVSLNWQSSICVVGVPINKTKFVVERYQQQKRENSVSDAATATDENFARQIQELQT